MADQSWQLKIRRAEEHARHLECLIEEYVSGDHYRTECLNPSDPDPRHYRLIITQEPDPWISVVLGDMLFNIRSALDHVAVAIAPEQHQRKVQFPVFKDKRIDACGKEHEPFKEATRCMAAGAVAVMRREQPFEIWPHATAPDHPAKRGRLYLLNELQNADKHRTLTVLGSGLGAPAIHVRPHGTGATSLTPYEFTNAEPRTEFVVPTDGLRHDEVDVQIVGTPHVTAEVRDKATRRNVPYPLSEPGAIPSKLLTFARDKLIPALEPFVRT